LPFAGVCVGLAVAAAGCGGTSAVRSAVDPVAEAAEATELASGFKLAVSEQVSVSGSAESITASGTGVFDERDHRGAVTITIHSPSGSTTARTLFSKPAVYLQSSTFKGSPIADGKPWVKLDLARTAAAFGIDASLGSGASSDPSQALSFLRASGGHVTRVGSERVGGVDTTRYHTVLDYDLYADRVDPSDRAAAAQSAAAIERLTGSHTQAIDVWVDAQHRVRREQYAIAECVPGSDTTLHLALTSEFLEFGDQPVPALPAANEVKDITGAITARLKGVKFGCTSS
jgi:hypothetical protein